MLQLPYFTRKIVYPSVGFVVLLRLMRDAHGPERTMLPADTLNIDFGHGEDTGFRRSKCLAETVYGCRNLGVQNTRHMLDPLD